MTAIINIQCPCGEELEIELNPKLANCEDGNIRIDIEPDLSDLWMHSMIKHPEAHTRPRVCQVADLRVREGLPCKWRESGGVQCESLEPDHGDKHWISRHTMNHSIAGNGWACAAIEE